MNKKRSLFLAVVLILHIVGAGGTYTTKGIWERTSTDSFCSRCHEMHPYVAAHAAGPHRDITCRRCHIGEQAGPAMAAKLRGLGFLASHYLETDGEPQGVVPDRACQAADCHPQGGSDSLPWQGLSFHHSAHRLSGQDSHGRKLRCATCHGMTRAPGHAISIRSESCLICHLTGARVPAGQPVDQACIVCHNMPGTIDFGGGGRLDHAKVRAAGHSCNDCHGGLAQGGGPIRAEHCQSCHPAEVSQHLQVAGIAAWMHRTHTRDSSVQCGECHISPDHHCISPWHGEFPMAGKNCPHVSGSKGDGEKPTRAILRLSCTFCHQGGNGGKLRDDRCTTCHEEH